MRLCDAVLVTGHADEAQAYLERLQPLLATSEWRSLAIALQADVLARLALYLSRSHRSLKALAVLNGVRPAMSAASGTAPHLRWLVAQLGPLNLLGRIDEARAVGAEVLALAPPDGRERVEVLTTLASIEHVTGHPQAAALRAGGLIALATRLNDGLSRMRGLFYRGSFRCELGQYREAEADLRDTAALAAGFGNVYMQRRALYNLASTFSAQFRADDWRRAWSAGPRCRPVSWPCRAPPHERVTCTLTHRDDRSQLKRGGARDNRHATAR